MCFSPILLLSRDRRPHSPVRKHVHVYAALPKGGPRTWPCQSGGTEHFQEETASGCSPGPVGSRCFYPGLCFYFLSPPFTSFPSAPLPPAPAKGKSGFILPLGPVYTAVATLCFAARVYREKITPASICEFFGCLEQWSTGWCLGALYTLL